MDEYITQRVGVPAYRAEDPMIVTAVGAGRALADLAFLRRTMVGI